MRPAKIANTFQCYIGDKSFQKAVALYQRTYPGGAQDEIRLTWLPFYLDANAPVQGVPLLERMVQKNGAERVNAIRTRVHRVGREHGIEFSFASKVGRTRDSHRLLLFAASKGPGVQSALVGEIFRMHFEGTADITSHTDLTNAAVAVGLSEAEVLALLNSEDYGEEADRLAAKAREEGISSVPFYKIGNRTVEGAESVSDFYEALIAARAGNKEDVES